MTASLRVLLIVGLALAASRAAGQEPGNDEVASLPPGRTVVPQSSNAETVILSAGLSARHAHTNTIVFEPESNKKPPSRETVAPIPFFTETPASIACIYGLVAKVAGCNPSLARENPKGGSNVIVVVDAYDAPNVAADLAIFCDQFGLPPAKDFEVRFAAGARPTREEGWELEASLDVEWAHAIAPDAKIVLVEAKSNSLQDLQQAEDVAGAVAQQNGGGQVSNSWGAGEYPAELSIANHFVKSGVVYFSATGDEPPVEVPSALDATIAVGGTTILRNRKGEFIGEAAWSSAGAGKSAFVGRPAFQDPISKTIGQKRGVPDLSAVSNPLAGGVWVYDRNYPGAIDGWLAMGGTSVATPIAAAIANAGGRFASRSAEEASYIYHHEASGFFDVTKGDCGPNGQLHAGAGWDFCSGVGTPRGVGGL